MDSQPNQAAPDAPNDAPVPPPTPMVYESVEYYWEYKQINLNLEEKEPLDEARLNKLGREGWELTATIIYKKIAYYYFKRTGEEND